MPARTPKGPRPGGATPLLLWARHGRLPAQAPGRAEHPRGLFVIVVLLIRSCGGDDEEAPVTPVAGSDRPRRRDRALAGRLRRAGRRDLPRDEHRARRGRRRRSRPRRRPSEARSSPASSTRCRRCRRRPNGADELENFLAALQDQVAAYDELHHRDSSAATTPPSPSSQATIDEAAAKAAKAAGSSASRSAATPRRSASPVAAARSPRSETEDAATEAPADDRAGGRP